MAGARPQPRRSARGFTLIEMVITVAIMALAAAIAVPALNNITRADLRTSASKLGGLCRRTYDDAALSGQTYRMLLDFESRTIKVEATEQVLNFEPGSNVLAEASKVKEDLQPLFDIPPELEASMHAQRQDDEPEEDAGLGMGALAAIFAVNDLGSMGGMAGEEAFAEGNDGITLAEEVRLMDVWVQGMDDPVAEGKVYLYFFPHGYTQDAIINLEDKDGSVFSIKIAALTGKPTIAGEYAEVGK